MNSRNFVLIAILCLFFLPCVSIAHNDECFNIPWCERQDFFFWNESSPDFPGYKLMNNYPELIDETYLYTTVSLATGEKTIATFAAPAGKPDVPYITPGLWQFRVYLNVSSAVGYTQYRFYAINRSASGVEIPLYYGKAVTVDIDNPLPTIHLVEYARRNCTAFFPGDTLLIRVNASTTSVVARDAWISLGGNLHASMVRVSWLECNEDVISNGVVAPELPLSLPVVISAVAVAVGMVLRKRGNL